MIYETKTRALLRIDAKILADKVHLLGLCLEDLVKIGIEDNFKGNHLLASLCYEIAYQSNSLLDFCELSPLSHSEELCKAIHNKIEIALDEAIVEAKEEKQYLIDLEISNQREL